MKKKASAIVGSVLLIVSVWLLQLPSAPSTLLAQYSWTTSIEVYKDITVVHTGVRTITNNETFAIDVKIYVTNTSEIHLLEYYALSANGTDFIIISGGAVIQSENIYYGLQPGQKLCFNVKAKPTDSIKVGDTITVWMKVELWVHLLSVTVATDKQTYSPKESVSIYGNLTMAGSPVDGLVALQVDDPSNNSIIIRTLETGTTSPDFIIVEVIPCDSMGNPKYSFERGTRAYFWVTVENIGTVSKYVLATVNVFDGDTVPLGLRSGGGIVDPGQTLTIISAIDIPTWAYLGTATVYASALTNLPRFGGVAYCPEGSAAFEITGGSTAALGAQELNNSSPVVKSLTEAVGIYSLPFKLSPEAKVGTYTVYVSSSYQELHDKDTATFEVYVPGDVNGDGHVNIDDLILFTDSWYKKIGDPDYNPNADFNKDGIVDIDDLIILTDNWYKW